MERPESAYTKLDVWNLAIDFCADVYSVTRNFPREEMYGLTRQIREAAASVAANIAEGSGRRSSKEFAHFLDIASGSLRETETLLYVALRVGYLCELNDLFATASRIGQMITRLRQSLLKAESTSSDHVH